MGKRGVGQNGLRGPRQRELSFARLLQAPGGISTTCQCCGQRGGSAAGPSWHWPHGHLSLGARRSLQRFICKHQGVNWVSCTILLQTLPQGERRAC